MKDVLKCSVDSSIFIMKTALWQLADIMPKTRRKKQGRDTSVQGTDDSSVLSKVQSGQKSPAHQQGLRLHAEEALDRAGVHSSHVTGERLLGVGGVRLLSDGVPGVLRMNLSSLCSSSVSWPLVLHSFCSELTDSSNQKLLLIGGGGNGFSFGTRLNLQPVTLDLRAALG
ncbi:hypothetical protein KUCAC02_029691 [Chaenocephalus aceratus]|nr:hypothetical protein KUCAC02_029691 [Chaenocephalus aceratus]